ncbi:hypothetical protein [Streptococcus oriscaviae]|uniref:Conjugal transfer protein n=1 Tax=Streptococcus oriscaviae TaxID=2781599 RepID=A0ABX7YJM1_9STRE|nr:hypothetical protein [Streptococcus oriscaviae]QUE53549.1 hypothetical protein INT76_06705 [Streptococcus oriscaviae]
MSTNLFEYKDGAFYVIQSGQEIDLADIGSKLLLDVDWNPLSGLDYVWNSIFNGVIWLAKFFFEIYVKLYDVLGAGTGAVDDLIEKVINQNATFFETVFNAIVPYAVVFLFLYALYMQVTRRGSIFKIMLVGIFTMSFVRAAYIPLGNGETGVSMVYNRVSTTIDDIASSVMDGFTGSSDNQALVTYFEEVMWKPYQGMNADMSKDGKYNLTDDQLIALFGYRDGNDDYRILGELIKNVVGTKEEPIVKNIRTLGNKFAYILVMFVEVNLFGIVLVAFSIFGFFLKTSVLFIFYFLPFLLLIAIFPFFSQVIFNTSKTVAGALLISGLVGIFSTLFMLFNTSLNDFYLLLFGGSIIMSVFMRAVTYYLMWRFRGWIGRLFTRGRLAPAGRILNTFKQKTIQTASKGLEMLQKPTRGGMLLATAGTKIGYDMVSKGYQHISTNRSVNRKMRAGDSFEVASLKTERDKEVKFLKRSESRQKIADMKHKGQVLIHDLMSKGYRQDSLESREHQEKSLSAQNKIAAGRLDLTNRRQRIKRLNNAIQFRRATEKFRKSETKPLKFHDPSGFDKSVLQKVPSVKVRSSEAQLNSETKPSVSGSIPSVKVKPLKSPTRSESTSSLFQSTPSIKTKTSLESRSVFVDFRKKKILSNSRSEKQSTSTSVLGRLKRKERI